MTARIGHYGLLLQQAAPAAPLHWCAVDGRYRFDASEAEILSAGVNGKLTMSNFDQTGAYTVRGSLVGNEYYDAFPAGLIAATSERLALSAGKKLIQAVMSVATRTGGNAGENAWSARIALVTPGLELVVSVTLQALGLGDSRLQVRWGINETTAYDAVFSSNTVRITIEFDATTNSFGVRADGQLLGLSSNSFMPTDAACFIEAGELAGQPASEAGKIISCQLITRAADMVGPVSAGYTDPCGNPI